MPLLQSVRIFVILYPRFSLVFLQSFLRKQVCTMRLIYEVNFGVEALVFRHFSYTRLSNIMNIFQ